MTITKTKLETLVRELPNKINVEDVMQRLYLLQKIEKAEYSITKGQTYTNQYVVDRISKKWKVK